MARKPIRRRRSKRPARKRRIGKVEKKAERPAPEKAGPERDEGTDTSADSKVVDAMKVEPEFFRDPLIGQTLGKCRIEKYIGEGKTAVVYRAQYEPLNRTVAVKVLQKEMTKVPAVVRVFQQEGRAVAALDHENVLKVYDVGEDRGYHYIVLELLHGKNLLELLEKTDDGRFPPRDALEYVRQAAAGLTAAHRKKLVHRDIKPQNLVVEPDGTLKIVDFGLAAEAEGAFSGGRLGTPHYMAPEQCRGENAVETTDIYALGVTLFHLLVGHPPYSGKTTKDDIIAEHLKGKRLEPEKARQGLPRSVGDLVRKMTRMDPGARPHAKEVRELITRLLEDKKVGRLERRGRGKARRASARRRQTSVAPWVALGAALVLGLLLVVVLNRGGDDGTGKDAGGSGSTARTTPVKGTDGDAPATIERPEKPAEPEDEGIDPATLRDLKALWADAETEEGKGSLGSALHLYRRVLEKAPPDTSWSRRAKIKVEDLAKLVRKTDTGSTKRISVGESKVAASEYREARERFLDLMKRFKLSEVREEMEALRDRTQEASPERREIERGLQRLGYLEGLVEIAASRAAALDGSRASWSRYDFAASPSLVVVDADREGVILRDEAAERERTLPWEAITPPVLVAFLDTVRNESSAEETLWLGFYCLLADDERFEDYFRYAQAIDPSEDMRQEIEALRELR